MCPYTLAPLPDRARAAPLKMIRAFPLCRATLILLLVHWCVGLPATCLYAARVGGGVVALMQAHTAAWLTATLTFGACYLGSPTLVATSAGLGGLPATSGGVPAPAPVTQHPLGVPLLPRRDGGRA